MAQEETKNKNCCNCISYRAATILISILFNIGCPYQIYDNIYFLSENKSDGGHGEVLVISLIVNVMNLILSMMLFYGSVNKNPSLCQWWLSFQYALFVIFIVLSVAVAFLAIVAVIETKSGVWLLLIIAMQTGLLIYYWMLRTVAVFIHQLKNDDINEVIGHGSNAVEELKVVSEVEGDRIRLV